MKGHLSVHRGFSGKVESESVRSKCSDVTLAKLEDVSVENQCCSFNESHGKVLLTVKSMSLEFGQVKYNTRRL